MVVLSATPLIVTRLRLDGGLGVDRESDGGSAVTLVLAHVQAKVLRPEWGGAEGWFSVVEAGAWATELVRVELVVFLLSLDGIWPRRTQAALSK